MKKAILGFAFLVVYIAGVTTVWGISGSSGWAIIFAFIWFYLTSKFISYIAVKAGWTERKQK